MLVLAVLLALAQSSCGLFLGLFVLSALEHTVNSLSPCRPYASVERIHKPFVRREDVIVPRLVEECF